MPNDRDRASAGRICFQLFAQLPIRIRPVQFFNSAAYAPHRESFNPNPPQSKPYFPKSLKQGRIQSERVLNPAAKRRKNAAHGASRGKNTEILVKPRKGRKNRST